MTEPRLKRSKGFYYGIWLLLWSIFIIPIGIGVFLLPREIINASLLCGLYFALITIIFNVIGVTRVKIWSFATSMLRIKGIPIEEVFLAFLGGTIWHMTFVVLKGLEGFYYLIPLIVMPILVTLVTYIIRRTGFIEHLRWWSITLSFFYWVFNAFLLWFYSEMLIWDVITAMLLIPILFFGGTSIIIYFWTWIYVCDKGIDVREHYSLGYVPLLSIGNFIIAAVIFWIGTFHFVWPLLYLILFLIELELGIAWFCEVVHFMTIWLLESRYTRFVVYSFIFGVGAGSVIVMIISGLYLVDLYMFYSLVLIGLTGLGYIIDSIYNTFVKKFYTKEWIRQRKVPRRPKVPMVFI